MNYDNLNDYELINLAKENDEDSKNIIIEKYLPLINKNVSKVYSYCKNNGLEKSDLIQEAMIALSNAIESYDNFKDVSFYTYAQVCIERSLINITKRSNRQKNKILNESISLDAENNLLLNFLEDNTSNPEDIVISKDSKNIIIDRMKKLLTPYEKEVYELLIKGFKYKEISKILEKDEKSVDNAIQRIKLKIKNELGK